LTAQHFVRNPRHARIDINTAAFRGRTFDDEASRRLRFADAEQRARAEFFSWAARYLTVALTSEDIFVSKCWTAHDDSVRG
jgi:hypothetical protein